MPEATNKGIRLGFLTNQLCRSRHGIAGNHGFNHEFGETPVEMLLFLQGKRGLFQKSVPENNEISDSATCPRAEHDIALPRHYRLAMVAIEIGERLRFDIPRFDHHSVEIENDGLPG